jgi:multiple sugar transport system ATP-binding protein
MILDHGKVLQIDTPDNIFYKPLSYEVARQVGQPAINSIECVICNGDGKAVLESKEERKLKLTLSDSQRYLLNNYKKETLLLGIRPKDISLDPGREKNEIEAVVDIFQPLGSEGVLTSLVGKLPLVGLVDPSMEIHRDQKVKLYLDTRAFYFFDPDTKENLEVR